MTIEQHERRAFCVNELTPLLRRALENRVFAEYSYDEDGDEYVEVIDENDVTWCRVDVSGESLIGLAAHVLAEI